MRAITVDALPHLTATAVNVVRQARDTAVARLRARWWGVDLGEGCRFCGLPDIRRMPDSVIRIGARCEFRSAPWSNQVGLNRPCSISTLRENALIEIGHDSGFSGAVIGAAERIVIGSHVLVGGNCTITDTDWHALTHERRKTEPGNCAPVVIEDEVFLSMNVIVLKGVTIGAGTVVAAGSVVSKSLPGGVIAGGAPARVLRELA
jgi:acetyltransferase-like isoleucine patch superfamily enzyme